MSSAQNTLLNFGSDLLCIIRGSKLYVKINTYCIIDKCSVKFGWEIY
jgi:hypothetical protein